MMLRHLFYMPMGIIASLAVMVPNSALAVPIDRIVAVVGDEVITQSALDLVLAQKGENPKASDAAPILKRMIEEKVILQTARRLGREVTDLEFERVLAEQESRFPNREALRAAAASSFRSWDDYLKALKVEVTMAKLIQSEMDHNLAVTEEEARVYYERSPERFQQADQIALDQILFASDADLEIARQVADEARLEIANGVSFEQIAERYQTPATSLGRFQKGELLPRVERIVFELPIGGISPVIQTPAGFHLFRVAEQIKGAPQSFETARPAIVSLLLNEKRSLLTRQWFNGLLKRTFIEVK